MATIRKKGITPAVGANASAFGETEPNVHVFYDRDHMDDAVANWDMETWGGEDEVPLTAIELLVPPHWVKDDPAYSWCRWFNRPTYTHCVYRSNIQQHMT